MVVPIEISVIVSTFNRCQFLKETLKSLLSQDFDGGCFEVIIVDNNSTDGTVELLLEYANEYPMVLKYVKEEQQGLSAARNRGVQGAKGPIVAFIDDDATAHRSWLKGLMEVYKYFPEAGVVGGLIEPVWISGRPAWLTQNLEVSFGVLSYGNGIKEIFFPDTLFGGNFSIKRNLFLSLGGFCKNLGRKGVRLLSNEEVFLCRLVEQNKKKIYYTSKAIVYHKVLSERLNKRYLLKRAYAQGMSNIIVEKEFKINQNASWRNDLHDLKEMIKGSIRRLLSGQREILTEDLFTIFFIFGKLRKQLF
jgi:glycosyltransferase involved in cell wall biosynthesis